MALALCHHLIIVFDCENSFQPSDAFHELFPFLSSEGHHVIMSHSQLSLLSSKSYRWIVQVYSLVSSWFLRSHVSKSPQVSSFVFQLFPVNCAFASFIFNSYGGSFKIPFSFVIISIIPSFQSYQWIVEDFPQVYTISLLIHSTRISSMPNPLLVINLNWWRINII